MSIIYDALQKTQKNRSSLRGANNRGDKLTWFDIALLAIIFVLVVFIIISYYPKWKNHSAHAQISKPQQKVAVVAKPAPVIVAAKTPRAGTVSSPVPIVKAKAPAAVPTVKTVAPVNSKPQVKSHPPIEQLFAPPVKGAVQSNAMNTPIAVPVPSAIPAATPAISAATQPQSLAELDYKGNLVLNGVFLSDQDKIAMINNQPYHLGDKVSGLKIISMDMNSVKLSDEKNIFVLRSFG